MRIIIRCSWTGQSCYHDLFERHYLTEAYLVWGNSILPPSNRLIHQNQRLTSMTTAMFYFLMVWTVRKISFGTSEVYFVHFWQSLSCNAEWYLSWLAQESCCYAISTFLFISHLSGSQTKIPKTLKYTALILWFKGYFNW